MKIQNLFIAILALAGVSACTKSDTPEVPVTGPVFLEIKEGFLTTKTGYDVGNLGDTAIIRVSRSSYQVAATYGGGIQEDKDHYWHIENAGGSMVYIRSRKYGTYLGFKTILPVQVTYHAWAQNWITLDPTPGDNNKFLLTKVGKNFYIQSAADQTQYLNTTVSPQLSFAGNLKPSSMFFLTTRQEFFFMKPF